MAGREANLAMSERVVDVKAGGLIVRLAEDEDEVNAALSLRYRVFYNEMHARPTPDMAARQQDFDAYDDFCDHLLVIDYERGAGADAVVGTYRLIRRTPAEAHGGFYTAAEYDIETLLSYPGGLLELGRSCVDTDYRNRATMQLLWRGIANYIQHFQIAVMFGCASLPGTDPNFLGPQLSYLYHYHLAPPGLRPRALETRYVDMRICDPAMIDRRKALADLPPLIKGYLRLGGFVGDGAVIDHQFNTTDVCIVVMTDWVTEKYYKHYTLNETSARNSDVS